MQSEKSWASSAIPKSARQSRKAQTSGLPIRRKTLKAHAKPANHAQRCANFLGCASRASQPLLGQLPHLQCLADSEGCRFLNWSAIPIQIWLKPGHQHASQRCRRGVPATGGQHVMIRAKRTVSSYCNQGERGDIRFASNNHLSK